MLEDNHYTVITTFTSSEKNWSRDYLTNPKNRLLNLIKKHMGLDFVKQYSLYIKEAIENNSILLRAEIIKDNSVILMNVWASEKAFDTFSNKLSGLSKISQVLEKENLSIIERNCLVDKQDIRKLFQNYNDCLYVIHYAGNDFRSTLATSS